MNDKTREEHYRQRPTEPLPKTVRPALFLLLFLIAVTLCIAGAAALVDRLIYG
ncbi:hypothetical protein [Alcanivorax sp. 24]|uniref:hypothetical protein n=1 Tax=Alcanivorax sp. 24 TaxID=2545266 RepID=UPI00141503CC|nr:hypothetical protein [Alcanivorax sp. 24]